MRYTKNKILSLFLPGVFSRLPYIVTLLSVQFLLTFHWTEIMSSCFWFAVSLFQWSAIVLPPYTTTTTRSFVARSPSELRNELKCNSSTMLRGIIPATYEPFPYDQVFDVYCYARIGFQNSEQNFVWKSVLFSSLDLEHVLKVSHFNCNNR